MLHGISINKNMWEHATLKIQVDYVIVRKKHVSNLSLAAAVNTPILIAMPNNNSAKWKMDVPGFQSLLWWQGPWLPWRRQGHSILTGHTPYIAISMIPYFEVFTWLLKGSKTPVGMEPWSPWSIVRNSLLIPKGIGW